MHDIQSMIGSLKRPKLLVRAARFGLDDYVRERHLPAVLGTSVLPRPGAALMQLMDKEADMNAARVKHLGDYAAAQHVAILIAIMGEARVLAAATRDRLHSVT